MRKITFLLSLLLCTLTAMAQGSLDLTFEKTSDGATVTVTGNGVGASGITATVTSNYEWKSINGNTTFPAANVLCPNQNTMNMTSGSEAYFYITLNNVPTGYTLKNTTFTSCALMGSGEFQTHSETQQVNFTLSSGDVVLGTKEDVSIKVNSEGGESVVLPFELAAPYTVNNGTLSLTLKLAKGTTNQGCFYGLTKISIETDFVRVAGLKVSDAPVDGNWAENTTWYKIKNKKGGWVSTASGYCNGSGYLLLNNTTEPTDDNAQWCIVGDETNGFKFYNKASGTTMVLRGSRTLDSANPSFEMSSTTSGVNVLFDIANSEKAGYIIIKDHDNQNNYWNYRGNNLAYWNDSDATNDDGSSFKFYNASYIPVSGVAATKNDRKVGNITLAGSQFGTIHVNNYTLTDSEKNSYYADLTESVTMYAVAGESLDLQCTTIGWMHTYVYIDKENNGFSASVDATDGYTPLEDLVSYSCYNSVQADGAASSGGRWYNSAGTNLNNDNKQDAPNFTAPAAGTYRVRLKSDWNSIKPQGGNQFQSAKGAAIDFTLKVISPDDTEEIANIKTRFLNEEITRIETAKNAITPSDDLWGYSQATLDELTAEIEVARNVANNALEKSADEINAAVVALQEAYELMQVSYKLPVEDGKVYRIKNVINTYGTGNPEHYIANGTTVLPTAPDNSTTLWVCQQSTVGNKCSFVSVIGDKGLAWKGIGTAVEFTIGAGVNDGASKLVYNNANLAVTNEAHNLRLDFNNATNNATSPNNITQADRWSTDFVFEEVTDYTGFATTIAQGSNGNYGTLHLPFAVTLPEGVTAHSVELSADGTRLKTTTLELANNTLPANTPVLLKGEEGGSKNFVPAASSGLSALSTGFTGTLGATAVTANSYILAFEGEAGSEIKFFALDGTDNTVNANKAYYVLPAAAQATRALRIDMAGTTGIDEVESESAQEVIYDLAGRRVKAITAPGIYIVNGNKVLVK